MIRCITKEEWDKASTEDLLNLLKVQMNCLYMIMNGVDRITLLFDPYKSGGLPRVILIQMILLKLGFPAGIFIGDFSAGGSCEEIDKLAHTCIDAIIYCEDRNKEKQLTEFEELDYFKSQVHFLPAPIGDLKKGDIVDLVSYE